MYYCMACQQVHTIDSQSEVFKTAFRAISQELTRVPLGYCHTIIESQELQQVQA